MGHDRDLGGADDFIVFDVETQYLANEVGGWNNAYRMCVSVAGAWDSRTQETRIYEEADLPEFLHLLHHSSLIVGFNSLAFDYNVLQGYYPAVAQVSQGDVMAESRVALNKAAVLGEDPKIVEFWYDLRRRPTYPHELPSFDILRAINKQAGFRVKLDSLCKRTIGSRKTGDGFDAIRLFRAGEMRQLKDYCRQDVELTKDLFLHIVKHGWFRCYSKRLSHEITVHTNWRSLLSKKLLEKLELVTPAE